MASALGVAKTLTGVCTPVPRWSLWTTGVCDVCHGAPGGTWSRCYSCKLTTEQVTHPCELVVPISLYEIPSQLHKVLRYYKHTTHPSAGAFGWKLSGALGYFLVRHAGCIAAAAGGAWDRIATVPSSKQRPGVHPLVSVVKRVKQLAPLHEDLLVPGPHEVGHRKAHDEGYVTTRQLAGERVLLIDDTFTTGARAQSAASAIALAGGQVAAVVAIGRVIEPTFNAECAALWAKQSKIPFDWDDCCHH